MAKEGKKQFGKIPTIFLDEETLRNPFTDIAEAYEERLWEKGGFMIAKTSQFTIGEEVLNMTIDYATQVRTTIRKDIYEVQNGPGPKKSCTIQEWLTNETKTYFETNCSSNEINHHLWKNLMPNGLFNNINYSNGNLKTLFPLQTSNIQETCDFPNLSNLKSPVRDVFGDLPGLTTPYLLVASSGAIFPWHIEEQVSKKVQEYPLINIKH